LDPSAPLRPPALNPAAIRAVAFDLDGTLVDSYRAIASSLNHARAHHDLAPLTESEARLRVGRGLESLIEELVGRDRVELGVRLFRSHYQKVYAEGTFLLPGVAETLEQLRSRGVRLSVASNKPARFGRPILERFGLLDHMDTVEGPDVAGRTKPDPAMLTRCMQAMQSTPATTLYVGDMLLDVESAARADLPVVLVAGGSSGDEELRTTGQIVLRSLDELPGILADQRR